MKSEIEKLYEQRKEVERRMKKVDDYVNGHTFQYAKGEQIKVVNKRADILAQNAKVALHKLTDLLEGYVIISLSMLMMKFSVRIAGFQWDVRLC